MRLLDRYLLRELLVPLCYCLCGFLLFWIAFELSNEMDDLQEHKLLFLDIVKYYLIKTPQFLVVVLPIALLLALLYTLTAHARHNEITAIRAAGVSLWRLSLPYLYVGFFASIALLLLNEFLVPNTTEATQKVLNRRLLKQVNPAERHLLRSFDFTNGREGRKWHIGTYNTRTFEMLDPQVIWTLKDGSSRWLSAERAVHTNGTWVFYEAREFLEPPGTNTALVPSFQTNMLAMPEFNETPEQIKSEIRISKSIGGRGLRMADIPISEIMDYLRLHPRPPRGDRNWLHTKLHGRMAAPWTCLVVVLIAIPFGAASGRRNMFVGVAGSVFIFFAYYILFQLGMALGMSGTLPSWLAAWLPNVVFGITGVWLTSRVR